ncbi:hypothetical protein EDB92DRAFT_1953012 [Lactarius akahatsu]|uniref:DUF6534 domain-containing protein n=1 Tax=Lactarius akahatsu TaxID=416441 RepID=A0AAD4LCI4_9AGAM|nr:hypothetical protein EDB92DRAFT_1953012 [Lactarius akahatsu]
MGALVPEDNNLGALFIGVILSAIVYGITWQQGYAYYTIHGNKDPLFLKILVSLLMVVDSVNLAFAAHGSYITSITNFGDYAADSHMPWSIPSIGITGMFLEVLIQHFYAYRVYRLSKGSLYMPVVIIVLSLTAVCAYKSKFLLNFVSINRKIPAAFGQSCMRGKSQSLGRVAKSDFGSRAITPNETEAHSKLRFFIASVAMQVACDMIITTSMVCYLLNTRTNIPRTDSILNTLALYTISCGTLTAISAIACLIMVSIYQHNWIYLPFYILQVRLYSCSFMSVLNSRSHIRRKFMGSNGSAITLSQLQSDTHSGALARLPLQHGTLPSVGRTTPPPTPGARRHLSLSLLESNIPVELEKRSSCS